MADMAGGALGGSAARTPVRAPAWVPISFFTYHISMVKWLKNIANSGDKNMNNVAGLFRFGNRSERLSVAVQYFLDAKRIQRLSPNTIIEYTRYLKRLCEFFPKDPAINSVTAPQLRQFLASYSDRSKKTQLNVYVTLSSLWSWSVIEGICSENIVGRVGRPKQETKVIEPFSFDEVKRLLKSLERSKEYSRLGKRKCSHGIQGKHRSKAIILLLLDTGMRASELCQIRLSDVNFKANRLKVYGKGAKERHLPFSSSTKNAIQKYINVERSTIPRDFLFVTFSGKPLRGDNLYQLIKRIGERAGLKAYPHKFRHTFAINFLRNGGSAYHVQKMLGHTSLEMTKRYTAIAESDVENVHVTASPVTNWKIK
jgi:site-specific recombinase XerD